MSEQFQQTLGEGHKETLIAIIITAKETVAETSDIRDEVR